MVQVALPIDICKGIAIFIFRYGFCFDIYCRPAKMAAVEKARLSVRVVWKALVPVMREIPLLPSHGIKADSRVAEVNGDPAFLFLC